MSPDPVIGPLFSAHVLEESILRTLQRWLPAYLTRACEIHGIDEGIEGIRSWAVMSVDDESWPEQATPALVVIGGETTDPEKHGDGMYRATWPYQVGVAVHAASGVAARRYAQVYGAALRGVLLQRRGLGESGQVTDWRGELTGGVFEDSKRRTTAATVNSFAITVDEVVSWRRGPASEEPPIPASWPTVKEEPDVEMEIE